MEENNKVKEENIFSKASEELKKEEINNNNNNLIEEEPKNKETESKEEIINPFIDIEKKEEVINPFFEKNNIIENKEETNNGIIKSDKKVEELINNPFFENNNIELNEKHSHNSNGIDLSNTIHFNVKIEKKKPKKLKFIIGVLSYALFIWLLLIGAALLVYVADIKIRQMKGDYSPPKYNAYVVLTGSMLPEIKVEDVVITKRIKASELKEGDIITFASSDQRFYGTIITHRIVKKYYDSTTKQYTFESKGDNNNIKDSALVEENNIHGKVILKIPKLGYLQLFLASKGGWILVILLPCLTVISFDIVKIAKIIINKRKIKIVK